MDYNSGEHFEASYARRIWAAIASVGWYLVAIAISLWYAFPYIRERYTHWRLKKDEQDYAAKYHKNSDLLQERESAVEASRQKMQDEYQQKCMLTEQEKEQKDALKKLSVLKDLNRTGQKLGSKVNDPSLMSDKKHRSLKGDYNPLTGDGTRGYRPPKRTCCGKGGCG